MTAPTVYPTASQFASASTHLETPISYVRVDGIRYAVVTSGTSGRVYQVWADASACAEHCIWWTRTKMQCSHMLAVELAALEDELFQSSVEEILGPAPKPRPSYAAVFGVCNARGCDMDRVRGGEQYCDRHLLVDAF